MNTRRLLAVDPSLTCSGWALLSIPRGTLLAVGKIRSLDPSVPLAARLRDLQTRVTCIFHKLELVGNDVLICEAPTTMRDPHAAIKVEQVRGIFEVVARTMNLSVPGRINPRSVHKEIMGMRGRQIARAAIKDAAVQLVHSLYGAALQDLGFDAKVEALARHQDIVDAVLVGSLGVAWIKNAFDAGRDLDEYFAGRIPARRQFRLGALARS